MDQELVTNAATGGTPAGRQVLWSRPGSLPGPRDWVVRGFPALLMLVLGAEALRISLLSLAGGQTGAFLGLLPVRALGTVESLVALGLALVALGRGLVLARSQLWQGLPVRLDLVAGELQVFGDGLGQAARDQGPGRPCGWMDCRRVVMAHVISRRRASWSHELRVWTGAWGSRVVAVAETAAGLEELRDQLLGLSGKAMDKE